MRITVERETGRAETILERATALTAEFPALAIHGARVSVMATRIVESMHPGALELRSHTQATAHLHDLGKLAISTHILDKPASLNREERDHIQRHAAIGANLLQGLGFPEEIVLAVRHHHEWWNGSGYPEGRSGASIPLVSRVIAVADAFDAMRSNRPYRKALSAEIALRELSRCSGTQFDPEIVAALLDLWPAFDAHPELLEPRTISS